MAIAYDSSSSGFVGTASSLTYSHTCTGTDGLLLVYALSNSGAAGTITGVTYNGVAMTMVVEFSTGSGPFSVWYLNNPATGANNVVVSADRGTNAIGSGSVSYTGCNQTSSVIDSTNTGTDTGVSSIGKSVTSTVDNCWGVIMTYSGNNGGHTAGTNTTERLDNNYVFIGDSNSAITPAGSLTLNVSYPINSTWQTWYGTIAPPSSATASKLALLGVG